MNDYDASHANTRFRTGKPVPPLERVIKSPSPLCHPAEKAHFAYTGREWDADIELYYYRARYYDPVLGKFISPDPIGFAGRDPNLSRYVDNSPTEHVDPSGQQRPLTPAEQRRRDEYNRLSERQRQRPDPQLGAAMQQQLQKGNNLVNGVRPPTRSWSEWLASWSPEKPEKSADDLLIEELVILGLDVAGIVDPTGACDVASAKLNWDRGEPVQAGISALAAVPYLLEWIKVGKLSKAVDVMKRAASRAVESGAFAERASPFLKSFRGAVHHILDNPTILNCIPEKAVKKLKEARSILDNWAKEMAQRLPRFNGPKPRYAVNPAHHPGTLRPDKTPLPNDAEEVFRNAVPDDPISPRNWFGQNADGTVYRFSNGNDGTAHFSGMEGVGDGIPNITRYARERLWEILP